MLENQEQESIAGIISDYCDGTISETDCDILALKIWENVVEDKEVHIEQLKTKLKSEKSNSAEKLKKIIDKVKPNVYEVLLQSGEWTDFSAVNDVLDSIIKKFEGSK